MHVGHVLILGAGSDVAVACGHEFARQGYDLYLAGRDLAKLDAHVKDYQIRHGVKAASVAFDANNFGDHALFYKSLNPSPVITICVFGLLGDQIRSQDDWKECELVIDANYKGAVSILNHVANDYEARKSGTIIGISSVAGDRGRQSNYIYGSAKAAFTAYLSGLRNRLARSGVHVMTVKPGFIRTKMTEGLRLPKPLTAEPHQVATTIFRGAKRRKNTVYVLPAWRPIMFIIRNIPEGIFKKLKL